MARESAQELAPGLAATLITDEQSAWRVADSFTEGDFAQDVAVSLVHAGPGQSRVTLYFRGPMVESMVRALTISAAGLAAGDALSFARIPRKDWVMESLHGLKPVTAGRFVVHGAHDRGCAIVNRIGIEIEAAQAFGTGHHGTTRGCLLALDRLNKFAKPRRMLDLGTGSGVLAIAAARSFRRRVLATDIDPLAVRIARDNARLNRIGTLVCARHADGLASPDLRAQAPFDLVLANILLTPLQKLASPLRSVVAAGGRVILAGLLKSQANAALAAYRGFALEQRIELDEWTTLVLKRRNALPLRTTGK